MRLAVGTFTDGSMGSKPAKGIYLAEFDAASGKAEVAGIIEGLHSPSFLCRHPNKPIVYAAERRWSADDATQGALSAWRLDASAPELIARLPSGGAFTAHVDCHPHGSLLSIANPLGPSVCVFGLDPDGVPDGERDRFQPEGTGSLPRQEAPWPHSSYWDRTGTHLFSCDLGLDRIQIFSCDEQSGTLRSGKLPFAQVNSGAGARHLAVANDNRFLYVANELDSSLCVFTFDSDRSSLAIVQCRPSVPDGFSGANKPAEIKISPDGRFLYVTNRGHDSIGIFAIDPDTGRITPVGFPACLGQEPRHIAFSPQGDMLFLANQMSGEMLAFAVCRESGTLTQHGLGLSIPSACCVLPLD